jgi:hypothetical protein
VEEELGGCGYDERVDEAEENGGDDGVKDGGGNVTAN